MSIDAVLFTLIIKPASSSTHLNLGGECRAGIRTLNPRIESQVKKLQHHDTYMAFISIDRSNSY